MIKIIKENNIITISGHAESDVYGKDIVCASVSSVVYTTINAIEKIKENSIKVIDDKNMIITINTEDEIVLKLIDNMFDILKNLEFDYPKYIKVKES